MRVIGERAFPLNLANLRIGTKVIVQDLDNSYSHYTNVVI